MGFYKNFLSGIVHVAGSVCHADHYSRLPKQFCANIWKETGQGNDISVFTKTEIPSSLLVLVLMSLLVYVKRNIRALLINHFLIVIGFVLS